jgi:hypothetical protein
MTRWFVLALVTLAFYTNAPALAEVCDKVAPSWNPGEPPVRLIDPAYISGLAVFMLPGLLIVGLCAFARWVGVGAVPTYILFGGGYSAFLLLLFQEDGDHDDIYLSAIREGCLQASDPSGRYIWIGMLLVFLALLSLTIRIIPTRTA